MQPVAPNFTDVPINTTVTILDGDPIIIYGVIVSSNGTSGDLTLKEGDGVNTIYTTHMRNARTSYSLDTVWLAHKGVEVTTTTVVARVFHGNKGA